MHTTSRYCCSFDVDTLGADLQPARALRERKAHMRRCAQPADARGPQNLPAPAISSGLEKRENQRGLLKPLAPVAKEDLKPGNRRFSPRSRFLAMQSHGTTRLANADALGDSTLRSRFKNGNVREPILLTPCVVLNFLNRPEMA